MTRKLNITLIGCGKMGSALTHGWVAANIIQTIEILDPSDLPESIQRLDNAFHMKRAETLTFKRTDIVVLAIKPQIIADILVTLKDLIPKTIPVLSIAAGTTIGFIQNHLGAEQPIIRTMPNTPAAIGKGITALVGSNINDTQKQMADTLFSAVSKTIWLDDESMMNAVTAVSGSGPAYVFYLIEALTRAGEKLGLPTDQSMQLSRQTVIGAAALAEANSDVPAAILRENVTSPKGTTEAALNILMDGKFQEILDKAVTAACNRGKELSN